MNRKLQTEKLTEATKRSLERTGFALVGLGAYVVDAARSKQTPDALTDAGRAILNGFERVEHRGRSAWPRAKKAAEDTADRAKRSASDAGDQAKQRAKETSARVRTSAEQARRRATETGVELREHAVEALTYLRNVAESRTGVHANYAEMTKEELYERAQDLDIDGRSEMDKDELVEALRRHDNPDFESMTKDELYELASEIELDGRSKMSKSELVSALNHWLAEQRSELVGA